MTWLGVFVCVLLRTPLLRLFVSFWLPRTTVAHGSGGRSADRSYTCEAGGRVHAADNPIVGGPLEISQRGWR